MPNLRQSIGLIVLLFLSSISAPAQENDQSLFQVSGTVRIYNTKHLSIHYGRAFDPEVEELAKQLEAFLVDLEKEWAVILPEEKTKLVLIPVINITLDVVHVQEPKWMISLYNERNQRVEIRISPPQDYEQEEVVRVAKHHLIHAILGLNREARLPAVFEEGIAAYYTRGALGRGRYDTILAYRDLENPVQFLMDRETYQIRERFHRASLLSAEFIAWVWERYPQKKNEFLHAFFRGSNAEEALVQAGLPSTDQLLTTFFQETTPVEGIKPMLFTVDFVATIFGLCIILWMIIMIVRAYRVSRRSFVDLTPVPELKTEVPKEAFSGPAFGGAKPPKPIVETSPPEPEHEREPEPLIDEYPDDGPLFETAPFKLDQDPADNQKETQTTAGPRYDTDEVDPNDIIFHADEAQGPQTVAPETPVPVPKPAPAPVEQADDDWVIIGEEDEATGPVAASPSPPPTQPEPEEEEIVLPPDEAELFQPSPVKPQLTEHDIDPDREQLPPPKPTAKPAFKFRQSPVVAKLPEIPTYLQEQEKEKKKKAKDDVFEDIDSDIDDLFDDLL